MRFSGIALAVLALPMACAANDTSCHTERKDRLIALMLLR